MAIEIGDPARRTPACRSPLGSATLTLYGTLLLLALAIPGSVVGSLREAPETPVTRAVLAFAERIQASLGIIGVTTLYDTAKSRFRAMSCGGPDSGNPC